MHLTTLPMISKNLARWMIVTPPLHIPSSPKEISTTDDVNLGCCALKVLDLNYKIGISLRCAARRQVRSQNWDENGDDKEYGYNEEIAMLEHYSKSARGEALLVHAIVDQEEVEVLIFKGLSSCLSYSTPPESTRSILPARAVIKTIHRIKGPLDPANIQYLQKGVTWEEFRTDHLSN